MSDQSTADDIGTVAKDPTLPTRSTYSNRLTTDDETFTYNVTYRLNNSPLEWKDNVKFIDPVDYRFEVVSAQITNGTGFTTDFSHVITDQAEAEKYKVKVGSTLVQVTVPTNPGLNETTDTNGDGIITKTGQYGGHVWKNYNLEIKVKLKPEYQLANNATAYLQLMAENNYLGAPNKAYIEYDSIKLIQNSDGTLTNEKVSKTSNSVYTTVPYSPDLTKNVNHLANQIDSDPTIDFMPNDNVIGGTQRIDVASADDTFYYQIRSSWPGLVDQFTIKDSLVDALEVAMDENGLPDVYITFNGKRVITLDKFITVNGNDITFDFNKNRLSAEEQTLIEKEISAAGITPIIQLNIHSKVTDVTAIEKYRQDGKITIPNKASIISDINAGDDLPAITKESNTVYVEIDEGVISKRINNGFSTYNTSTKGEVFEYEIHTKVPSNIKDLKEFYIQDKLDSRIIIDSFEIETANRDAFELSLVDEAHETGSQVLYAKMKVGANSQLQPDSNVLLIIKAHLADDATGSIENTAEVHYDNSDVPPSNSTFVTAPPTIQKHIDHVIAERQAVEGDLLPLDGTTYHADMIDLDGSGEKAFDTKDGTETILAIWNDPFKYTIDADIPKDARNFTIKDTLNYAIQPYKGNINGVADERHLYLVNADGTTTESITLSDGTVINLSDYIQVNETLGSATEQATQSETIENLNTYTILVESSDIQMGLTSAQLDELKSIISGNKLRLTFYAQFKEGTTVNDYVNQNPNDPNNPWVPNTAQLNINFGEDVQSNPVYVMPKMIRPEIDKLVDTELDGMFVPEAELKVPVATFMYQVKSSIPYNVKQFKLEDKLESVVRLFNHNLKAISIVWSDTGESVFSPSQFSTAVTSSFVDENGNSVDTESLTTRELIKIEFDQVVAENPGREFTIIFPAEIKIGTDLTPYRDNSTGVLRIPNTATFTMNNKYTGESESAIVLTQKPRITKSVKTIVNPTFGNEGLLSSTDEVFEYKISTRIPFTQYPNFVISDELHEVLTFADGDVKVLINGVALTDLTGVTITREGQQLLVNFDAELMRSHFGQTVEVIFPSRIKTVDEDATVNEKLAALTPIKYSIFELEGNLVEKTTDKPAIPNTAEYSVPGDANYQRESNTVVVTWPADTPVPTKTVNGNSLLILDDNAQEITYELRVKVPNNQQGYQEFTLTDDLEDILTITEISFDVRDNGSSGPVTATVTSVDEANQNNGKVAATIDLTELSKLAGKEIALTIKAKIKDGATDTEIEPYLDGNGNIVNIGSLVVGDQEGQTIETNEVYVTPLSEPEIHKSIIIPGQENTGRNEPMEPGRTVQALSILNDQDSPFEYEITFKTPSNIVNYTSFVMEDMVPKEVTVTGVEILSGSVLDKFTTNYTVNEDGTTSVSVAAIAEKIPNMPSNMDVYVRVRGYLNEGTNVTVPNTAKLIFTSPTKSDEILSETPLLTPAMIELTKEANIEAYELDGEISYTFTVKNTGASPLYNVEISDPLLKDFTTIEYEGGKKPADIVLQPNESIKATAKVTVSEANLAALTNELGIIHNEASVKANPEDKNNPGQPMLSVEVKDEANADVLPKPSISLVKMVNSETFDLGDTLTYNFYVLNTGNITLYDVKIEDKLPGISDIEYFNVKNPQSIVLEPSGLLLAKATIKVTEDNIEQLADAKGVITNDATVTGYPEDLNNPGNKDEKASPVTDAAADDSTFVDKVARVELMKTVNNDGKQYTIGETVTYTLKVTNNGQLPLKQIVISDDKLTALNAEVMYPKGYQPTDDY